MKNIATFYIFCFLLLNQNHKVYLDNREPLNIAVIVDTDGDGIDDSIDLDDDNDGIPDAIECGEVYCGENVVNGSFEQPNVPNGNWQTFNEGLVPGWRTTAVDGQIEIWNGFLGIQAAEGKQMAELNAFEVSSLYQELCISGGSTVRWSVKHRGREGVDVANVKIGANLASATIVRTMSDGTSAWGAYSGTYVVPLSQDTTFFIFESVSTSSGVGSTGNLIDDIVITILQEPICTTDFDGDGIPNSLDLDSDNDGIYDVIEGGNVILDEDNDGIIDGADTDSGTNGLYNLIEASPDSGILINAIVDSDSDGIYDAYQLDSDLDGCNDVIEAGYTDPNNDGLLGNVPITVDAQGVVTSGFDGYTVPLDGDFNSVFDFREVGVSISIITQPTDQTDCENNTITFSVDTSLPAGTGYQWKENSGGNVWNTITNTGIYSGATTNTLTITNHANSLNNYRYRIVISNLSYRCDVGSTSNEVTLTSNPLPNRTLNVDDPVICFGESANIRLANSEVGISYQLRLDLDDSPVGTPIVGTGADINFVVTPATNTTYNVFATNTITNCFIELTDKSHVVVNPLPIGNLGFSDVSVCIGDSVDLTVENSEVGIEYQLRLDSDNSSVGTPIAGTGGDIIFTVTPSVTTVYNLLATHTATTCGITQANKSAVTVNPLPVLISTMVDLTQCDDDADGRSLFNLTEANALISVDYLNETFTYYSTQIEAEGGLVADQITTFTVYQNITPVTGSFVFTRVETTGGCYRTARINLEVGVSQIPPTFTTLEYVVCDDKQVDNDNTNGIASFDFSNAKGIIEGLFPSGVTATFYNNQADALAELNAIPDISNHRNDDSPFSQDVFVRIDSDNVNACLGLGHHITLTVDSLPIANTISDYVVCSNTNLADFDLTAKDSEVIGTQIRPILISYHASLNDAESNMSPLTILINVPSQTIYVRAQFDDNMNGVGDAGECVSTDMLINLIVIPNPIVFSPEPIRICNDQVDTEYNLTIREDQITGGDSSITLTYFESQIDLNNNNPIPTPTTYLNSDLNKTILVLATGTNTCTSTINLELETIIYDALNLNPIPIEECEIDNNGYDDFDLRRRETDILNGLNEADFTFTYYKNETDAIDGNTNNINDPASFENTEKDTQRIYIRIKPITNECYQIATVQLIVNPVPEIQIDDEYIICLDTSGMVIPPLGNVFLTAPPIDTQLNVSDYSFQWYSGNNADPLNILVGETNSTFSPTAAGNYTVIATNLISGCTIPATTNVVASYPPESITAQATTDAFSKNNIIEVTLVGNGEYEFNLDDGTWQSTPIFENVRGGKHIVYVRDIYNCNELTSEIIRIIDYPKFFTPNGDGYHDTWQIYDIDSQLDAKIYIFDRYGKLLKQLIPSDIGWNGTLNGRLLPSNDYWFTVEYNEPNTSVRKIFKAHFTLKR